MTRFYKTRAEALSYWINNTNRIITDQYSSVTENIKDTFECKWQNNSLQGHVSIFCSLGDWASNITDILRDESLDKNYFEDQNEATPIYRYYTRFLLVVSEILTDFQDLYIQAKNLKSDKKSNTIARDFLCSSPEISQCSIQELFNFINKICKHKTSNIHKCNHHLPYFFSDNVSENHNLNEMIHIKNLNFTLGKSGILVPKLADILNVVIVCYKKIDFYFDIAGNPGFERICKQYSA